MCCKNPSQHGEPLGNYQHAKNNDQYDARLEYIPHISQIALVAGEQIQCAGHHQRNQCEDKQQADNEHRSGGERLQLAHARRREVFVVEADDFPGALILQQGAQ